MKFKTLIHKKFKDQFGHFMVDGTISKCDIPALLPMTCTKEGLIKYWEPIVGELDWSEYKLITIELNEINKIR